MVGAAVGRLPRCILRGYPDFRTWQEACSTPHFWTGNVNDLAGPDGLDGFEQAGKNRPEILDVVVGHGNDDQPQLEFGEILLVLQILVDGYKDIEALLGESHQLAIGDTSPTHRLNRLDFVVGERFSDAWIDALI